MSLSHLSIKTRILARQKKIDIIDRKQVDHHQAGVAIKGPSSTTVKDDKAF